MGAKLLSLQAKWRAYLVPLPVFTSYFTSLCQSTITQLQGKEHRDGEATFLSQTEIKSPGLKIPIHLPDWKRGYILCIESVFLTFTSRCRLRVNRPKTAFQLSREDLRSYISQIEQFSKNHEKKCNDLLLGPLTFSPILDITKGMLSVEVICESRISWLNWAEPESTPL
ncbi:hypothetical protein METSCH_A11120 [Metschnikowia aff. pulcherrima]|uniref:Uncharacterized protein n=1 Tax=Metschnikowia aff. pulcherrima TaxID=2163413 RepID=A0A4P6XH20_9ASCO|nr:hypothetical protein METSCH_A11120 [Metschnikowia aff. pulcherrima]